MFSFIQIALSADLPEAGFVRAGFLLTIVALAYMVRQPRKSIRK